MMMDPDLYPAADAYGYPLLVKHLLHTPLATTPGREIVYAHQRRHSYAHFRERLGRLASALTALGLRPGQVVAVMDWDSHRYLECFFAIPMAGAVLHTVNVRLPPDQILYTIEHAEDDWLLLHEEFLPLLKELAPRLQRPLNVVLLHDDPELDVASVSLPGGGLRIHGEYEALLGDGDPAHAFADFDESTRATTFYTTGTTGRPKGVHYSHRQIVLHTLAVAAGVASGSAQGRFHRDDVYMPITPMFHVHAWGIPFVATLLGVKQVYPGRYDPATLLRLIRDEGVTFSHCVPTIAHMLLTHPDAAHTDLTGWKLVIGGSALSRGLARQALARGIDVYTGYGMSETCPVLTLAQLDAAALDVDDEDQLTLRCRTGRPMPMVDLQVVDPEMQPLAPGHGRTGEVVVRAPWATQSYYKDAQGSAALWHGGYLHTGDIGFVDDAGYLQVTDRLKDVIKSGGEWISSLELEDIASGCEGVAEAAAVGIADERWGERPLLLLVPSDADDPPDPDSVRAVIQAQADAGHISRFAVPQRIEVVAAVPKTSVGKIDKKRLREEWGNEGDATVQRR
jgi:fatty-acyl-CoA synthase